MDLARSCTSGLPTYMYSQCKESFLPCCLSLSLCTCDLSSSRKKKEVKQRKKKFSVGEHEKKHTTNHKRTFELNETELLVSTAAQSRYLLGRYVVNIKPKPFLLSFFPRNVQCRKKEQKEIISSGFFYSYCNFLTAPPPL